MGKKNRSKRSKKKSKSATVDQLPKEANATSPRTAVTHPVPRDSSDPISSVHERVKKEHVQHMPSGGGELSDDAFGELASAIGSAVGVNFGNPSPSKNDPTSFLTSMLDTTTLGKSPRCSFDKNMVSDRHAWCVDEEGNVCDYPDEQNKHGAHSTANIVRRPWDARMVAEALPHFDKHCQEEFLDRHPHTSREEWIQMIHSNTFPPGNCFGRAKILRDSNPEKYALVIGSLGYKQSDGTIFWEFG